MVTSGDDCIGRPNSTLLESKTTQLWHKHSFPSAGSVTSWCCNVDFGSGNCKLKIFRDDGTNYIYVGESVLTSVSPGLNSNLPADIIVQAGDILGLYIETKGLYFSAEYGGGTYAIYRNTAGDITYDTPKTDWGVRLNADNWSLQVTLRAAKIELGSRSKKFKHRGVFSFSGVECGG